MIIIANGEKEEGIIKIGRGGGASSSGGAAAGGDHVKWYVRHTTAGKEDDELRNIHYYIGHHLSESLLHTSHHIT